MNILLDEGVPRIIQKRLNQFSISSVEEMGWRAVENGALLDLMAATFQVLITTDKNIAYQQNLKKRGISVILLPTNQIPLVINSCRKLCKQYQLLVSASTGRSQLLHKLS